MNRSNALATAICSVAASLLAPVAALAAPSTGILTAPGATWTGSCSVSPLVSTTQSISTPANTSCDATLPITVPATVKPGITSARAVVFSEVPTNGTWTFGNGLREQAAVIGAARPGDYTYGPPHAADDLQWTSEHVLPLTIKAPSNPFPPGLVLGTPFSGYEIAFDDTTPPVPVRFENLPTEYSVAYGSMMTVEQFHVWFTEDGPMPYSNADGTTRRYDSTGTVGGKSMTVATNGWRWDPTREFRATVQGAVFTPTRSGDYPVVVNLVDAVGNTSQATTAIRVTMTGTPPGPRALTRAAVLGSMRVGTRAVCRAPRYAGTTRPRIRYQWTRNGRIVPRAATRFLRLTRPMRGTRVACSVHATAGGGTSRSIAPARRVVMPRPR